MLSGTRWIAVFEEVVRSRAVCRRLCVGLCVFVISGWPAAGVNFWRRRVRSRTRSIVP